MKEEKIIFLILSSVLLIADRKWTYLSSFNLLPHFSLGRGNSMNFCIGPCCWCLETFEPIELCPQTKVFYHLQKVPGKSRWKVNGTRLFKSFWWKISQNNATREKFILFFHSECSKQNVPFFQSQLRYKSQTFVAVFRWVQQISANGKWNSGMKFTLLTINLPKLWTDLFTHV